ncbi:MAG: flippase [Lachnospiraceae bacterium]|nr:flippase [Lachnospiraceae bacterium]
MPTQLYFVLDMGYRLNLGKYNFSLTYIGYYALIAGLGISTYCTREGVKNRENKKRIQNFASEIYTLNMLSTFFSMILFLLSIVFIGKIREYRIYILWLAPTVFFTTYGVNWIFTVYEDYLYTTVRSIVLQILTVLMVFAFIKSEQDLVKYCIIHSGITLISSIADRYNANKYCKIRFCLKCDYIKHLKSVLILFASAVAVTIYTSSDITILGIMRGDYEVGLYSISVKIYGIFKTLFSSLLVVSVPRMCGYIADHKNTEYNSSFSNIYTVLLTFIIPAMTGLFIIAENIILVISGKEYINASSSLRILSIALIICFGGFVYSSCVLIPNGKEKELLFAMSAGCVVNVALNIVLIPLYGQDAAAFTTLIAEMVSLIVCRIYSKGLVTLKLRRKDVCSVIIGSVLMIICCLIVKQYKLPSLKEMLVQIIISVFAYGTVMMLFHNTAAGEIISTIKGMAKKLNGIKKVILGNQEG